jgi:hypothetical protein
MIFHSFLCIVLQIIVCPFVLFSFWLLCCLSFDLRILITPLYLQSFLLTTLVLISVNVLYPLYKSIWLVSSRFTMFWTSANWNKRFDWCLLLLAHNFVNHSAVLKSQSHAYKRRTDNTITKKKKGQKDKQWSAKQYIENYRSSNMNPSKNRGQNSTRFTYGRKVSNWSPRTGFDKALYILHAQLVNICITAKISTVFWTSMFVVSIKKTRKNK